MGMDENKVEAILNKYNKAIRNAGAFFLEVDDKELFITDSCEGVDMVSLNKEMCLELSNMFRELGESLS